jgi:hypothetical protein
MTGTNLGYKVGTIFVPLGWLHPPEEFNTLPSWLQAFSWRMSSFKVFISLNISSNLHEHGI